MKYLGPKTDSANVATQGDLDVATVLNGAGAPSSGLGQDGDFYIDTTANAIYGPKTAGSWGSATSLVGPKGDAGDTGATGAAGATGPAGPQPDLATTNPTTIQPDATAAQGSGTTAARADHTHAIVADAPSSNLTATTTNAEGSSTSFARADHTHAIAAAAPSSNLTATTTNAEGSSTSFARADHSHAITTGTPSTITGTNATGSSESLARADHNHALGTNVITATQLRDDATTDANRSVTTDHIRDGAVTAVKLASGVGIAPTGSILLFAGSTAPSGWLFCVGEAGPLSTTTYAALFAVIGYTYGGSGSTFYGPDLRGRVPMGAGNGATGDGLSGTGLVTGDPVTTAMTARSRGEWGGKETHTLSTAELANHTHTYQGTVVTNTTTTGSGTRVGQLGSGASSTSSSTGGGGAHNNLQPYIVLNYIIKT